MDKYINKLSTDYMSKADEMSATQNELIEANLRFVVNTAHKYKGKGLDFEDLVQAGNHGLVVAAEKFDKSKGIKFITFAVYYIKLYIREALTAYNNKVKRSASQQHIMYKIVKFVEKYTSDHGHEPTHEEISKHTNISLKTVKKALQYEVTSICSINNLMPDGETTYENAEFISTDETPLSISSDVDDIEVMMNSLDILSDKERYVIEQKYFNNKTFKWIGTQPIFGNVTPAYVKFIETNALKKLKKQL